MNHVRGRNYAAWLLAGGCTALACDTLYGFDSSRPALGDNDKFEVAPSCVDLPIDPSGLAVVPTVITLTGLRERSGLGAESVPVAVRIGACDSGSGGEGGGPNGAAGRAAAPDEPVEGGTAPGGAGAGGADAEPAPSARCSVGTALSSLDAAHFELTALEARGCRQRSPAVLECTLDANGEAAFGIVSRLQDDFNLTGYLPICATPFSVPRASKHETEIAVVPRAGTSRVALAVVRLDEQEATPTVAARESCASLLDCNQVRERARFQIGVVSRDIPSAAVRKSDFRPVTRDVVLKAEHQVLSSTSAAPAPFISKDPSCGGQEMGAAGGAGAPSSDEIHLPSPTLDLHIGAGQSGSEVFYLCAPSFASQVEITPALVDGSSAPPFTQPHAVSLPALTASYKAVRDGDNLVLYSEECGEPQGPVTPGEVPEQPGLSPDATRLLLQCGPTPTGAGGADGNPPAGAGAEGGETTSAGAGMMSAAAGTTSGGAGPEPVMKPSAGCALSIDLGPAGSCLLTVESQP